MHSIAKSLTALALACSVAEARHKPCSFATNDPFTLYADRDTMAPLYVLAEYPDQKNDIFHGLSTTSPGKNTPSIFEVEGANLMAVKTQYPKMTPFQTTFVNNASIINFVPVFQHPPSPNGLNLLAIKGSTDCLLAENQNFSDFYLCEGSSGEPFVAFFKSGPFASCNKTTVIAKHFSGN